MLSIPYKTGSKYHLSTMYLCFLYRLCIISYGFGRLNFLSEERGNPGNYRPSPGSPKRSQKYHPKAVFSITVRSVFASDLYLS